MTNFTVNEDSVEAEVYVTTGTPDTPVYLVKVSFWEIGVYINGIRVQESPKFPDRGLWVQLPGFNVKGRFYKTIECSKDSPFFELVNRKAQEAVEKYRNENEPSSSKDLLNDIPDWLNK
ncbi:MAG TPA: hypothetical protein VMB52_06265 [Verrucomicrobiae bacterium]|nr:hypothetical protein [Verrucomicrobiae bacterium]